MLIVYAPLFVDTTRCAGGPRRRRTAEEADTDVEDEGTVEEEGTAPGKLNCCCLEAKHLFHLQCYVPCFESNLSSVSLVVDEKFEFMGRPKGQATMELLAAYAIAEHPVAMVLTDSHVYHLLRLRGTSLICWANLKGPVAMQHLAVYLRTQVRACMTVANLTWRMWSKPIWC